MTARDRKAVRLLAVVAVPAAVMLYFTYRGDDTAAPVVGAVNSIPVAEKRLERLRQIAAQAPGKQKALEQVEAHLAQWEKRLLVAETAQQAQAQLLQLARKVGRGQMPPVEVRGGEFGTVRPLGADYGQAPVTVTFECRIEQLLNLLTEITQQPELAAVEDLRIYAANPKEKLVNVRVTLTAPVPRRLVPEKKGGAF